MYVWYSIYQTASHLQLIVPLVVTIINHEISAHLSQGGRSDHEEVLQARSQHAFSGYQISDPITMFDCLPEYARSEIQMIYCCNDRTIGTTFLVHGRRRKGLSYEVRGVRLSDTNINWLMLISGAIPVRPT